MSLGFRGKTVYVYGLGRSGQASIHALLEDGAQVWMWDDTQPPLHLPGVGADKASFVDPETADWKKVDALLKSPGIANDASAVALARKNRVPVIGDIDLLFRRNPNAQFVGITGTNGKSTTTALVAHALEYAGLEVAMGGNIGKAALQLPQISRNGVYVLELSSFQLEQVSELELDAAAVLNLTPDHLDRYTGLEDYAAAKMKIFNRCRPGCVRVLGVDNPLLADLKKDGMQTFAADVAGSDYKVTPSGELRHKGRMVADLTFFKNLPGPHNWQNIAAAYMICQKWLTTEQFFAAVKGFLGLPHRLELVHKAGPLQFINDSKATNPDAAAVALQSFENIYWIVGGLARAGDPTPCLPYMKNVRAAFAVGESQDEMNDVLESHVSVFKCDTLDVAFREAVATAVQEGLEQATILLSPACASLDQFESYAHRGDAFANLARKIVFSEPGKLKA